MNNCSGTSHQDSVREAQFLQDSFTETLKASSSVPFPDPLGAGKSGERWDDECPVNACQLVRDKQIE